MSFRLASRIWGAWQQTVVFLTGGAFLTTDLTSGLYFYISAFWMPLSVFLRLEGPSYEVMQLEFEVDNVIDLVPTQTLHWNVEYPAGTQTPSRQTEKVSHLYISNADIQGIVPLAEVRGNSPEHRQGWEGSSTWQIKGCWNNLFFFSLFSSFC